MPGQIHTVVASLILEGLRRVAPSALDHAADVAAVENIEGDGVPLEPYRRILARALDHDGGLALLKAGGSLRGLSHPFLFVLLNADSPSLLIEKEARLAAFIHSRHHVVIDEVGERSVTLTHRSRHGDPEPSENLASCGQHLVLLEEIGCQGLQLSFPQSRAPSKVVYDAGTFETPAPGGGYQTWLFSWTAYTPARKPMPGLDELLLAGAPAKQLSDHNGPEQDIERIVRRDLGRTWRVSEVADALGTSARSLQRSLSAVGQRYSDVLDRVRNDEAARLLHQSELSVTEIGYVCGFADSAHFSRSFKKRFGQTPSLFRRDRSSVAR